MILLLCREIYIGSFYQHAPPLISSTERQQQLIKIHDLIDSFLAENIPEPCSLFIFTQTDEISDVIHYNSLARGIALFAIYISCLELTLQ